MERPVERLLLVSLAPLNVRMSALMSCRERFLVDEQVVSNTAPVAHLAVQTETTMFRLVAIVFASTALVADRSTVPMARTLT